MGFSLCPPQSRRRGLPRPSPARYSPGLWVCGRGRDFSVLRSSGCRIRDPSLEAGSGQGSPLGFFPSLICGGVGCQGPWPLTTLLQ